ncbi:MAG: serine/threonine protein kinase [Myxococcaceae bacterium]|nr:serine/threonine protein kinase [Myxococcaceae bacterium]
MALSAAETLTSCPACGAAVPFGARFCPSCGNAIEVSMPPPAPLLTRTTGGHIADPLIGQVIAERYRIMETLGRGGMGVVYRVEHVHIGKLMAMKLLSGELAHDPQTLKRFQREAKVISKLSHPNTVQIFDFGESARLAYLVMEYLPGRSLASLIASEHVLPPARLAQIGAQIAASVQEAHKSGVIHRDIKPENVMILDTSEQRDFVKVLDFGIAKLRDADDALSTQKGHLIGTPYYMAPEQIRGEPIDHRVDIYALGALLYQAATGQLPFTGATPMEILGQHLNGELVPVRQRAPELGIPEELERIIGKAMSRDPDKRHKSMAALRDELQRFLRSLGLTSGAFEIEPERVPGIAGSGEVATRVDIDHYEKDVVRANRFGKVAGVLLALAALAVAYALFRLERSDDGQGMEVEPNDEPVFANRLVPGRPLQALIGKRKSIGESDADVYRVELADQTARVADISVSALPNMDLAIDLVEKGSSQPLLSVDSGGVGRPERIPNITLSAESYFVRVRQVRAAGTLPIENVSDSYTIALSLSTQDPGREREINDAFELANKLTVGTPLRGLIGWAKDHDVYCVTPSAEPQIVLLSAVPELDLVLSYLDRATDAGQRIDHHGVGQGERIELPASNAARSACFTVSLREQGEGKAAEGKKADPEHSYQIELQSGR